MKNINLILWILCIEKNIKSGIIKNVLREKKSLASREAKPFHIYIITLPLFYRVSGFFYTIKQGMSEKIFCGEHMEYLDIRDLNGNVTGKTKERAAVHSDGDVHGTSHVWIARQREDGGCDILLQKRSRDKDSFPGCYDISSAGHLPAGQGYLESAIRELEEELGICAKEEELIFLGLHEGYSEEIFYGKPFRNHEIARVYLYNQPIEIHALKLQKEEVESVKWMDLDACYEEVKKNNPEYIVFPAELEMIKKYYREK